MHSISKLCLPHSPPALPLNVKKFSSWAIEGSCTQLDMAAATDSAEPMVSFKEGVHLVP